MEDVMMCVAMCVAIVTICTVYVAAFGICLLPFAFLFGFLRALYHAFRGIDETKTKTKNTDCHNCQSYHSYHKTCIWRP